MVEACGIKIDRKLFAQAAEVTRKLNGHNEHLDLTVIQRCGEQLRGYCPTSLAEFKAMSKTKRRVARRAVQSALLLDSLPSDEEAFGSLINLRGQCKSPGDTDVSSRGNLQRLFQYVSSTVVD